MKSSRFNLILVALSIAVGVMSACVAAVPEAAPIVEPADQPVSESLADAAGSLTAQAWQWIALTSPMEQFDVATPERYRLIFNEDGIVEIVADCNTAIAAYGIAGEDAGLLTMSVAPRTEETCPPDSRGDQFLKLLGGAANYFFQDGRLYIDLMADGGTMVFDPVEVDGLTSQTDGARTDDQKQLVATLGNLTYSGLFPDQTITLVNGRADYVEPGPGTPFVSLVDRLIPIGDLDGDGAADAVALLEDHSSGSGNFLFLAAVLDAIAEPAPTTALMLGDRIQVKSLAIEGDQVVAELIAQGGSDAACCPTWNVRKRFALQDGALAEISSEELSQATLADLNGASWRLIDLGEGQAPLLPDAEITLAIDGGQISGSAGCNNYTASVTSDADVLQSFAVGPIAATRMACPDAVLAQEATYLALLESVLGWRYNDGLLAIAYPGGDDIYAYLLFAPQTTAAQAPAPAGGEAAVAGDLPRFEPLDTCFAEPPEELPVDLNMDCGYVVVPESRNGDSDREVKLGITRLNSGQGTANSPLFMLAGGPGQTEASPEYFGMFQPELLGGMRICV